MDRDGDRKLARLRRDLGRLTPQGRLLLVKRITEAGWSVVQAAQAAGISVRQSYRWLARYRAEGAAGLADRSSAPHRCQHRTAGERVGEIERLRRQRMSGPQIAPTAAGYLAR